MTRDATANEEKSSRIYWGLVLWPFVVVLLYALSIGPAVLTVHKGLLGRGFLRVYSPLERATSDTFLTKRARMYLHLWCPDVYNANGDLIKNL